MDILLFDHNLMYRSFFSPVSSKIKSQLLHRFSGLVFEYRAMTSPPSSPSYANIAALAAKPRSMPRARTTDTSAANTAHESRVVPTAQPKNRPAASTSLEPRTMPIAQSTSRPTTTVSREPRAAKPLPYVAPGRRTSTSQANATPFSASEVEQLSILKGPAADDWRTGTSRSQNTDRYRTPRNAPSTDSYRPSYAATQRDASAAYPGSQRRDTPRDHGSEKHGSLQDLRSRRYSPYPYDRGYAPRSVPPSGRTPAEPKVINVTLPAKGPEDKSRDVDMAWHCKVPNNTSEVDFIRNHSAEMAKEGDYDEIRVRMAIHNTKSVRTERGLESVAGQPFHFTVEFQKSNSPNVDTSHIYTDTRRVRLGPLGQPIYQTVGLATAGVTKGANGKVVDQVIETFKNGTRRAVGFSNRTEKINWEYKPDLNNLDY